MLSVTSDDGLLTSIEDSFSSFINLKSFLYFRFLVIRIAEDISSLVVSSLSTRLPETGPLEVP